MGDAGPSGRSASPYLTRCAPIAQKVERLICNQDVAGSIPAGGTKRQPSRKRCRYLAQLRQSSAFRARTQVRETAMRTGVAPWKARKISEVMDPGERSAPEERPQSCRETKQSLEERERWD